MTMRGIDISNWQKGFYLESARPGFVIVKSTEGNYYVDKCCDGFVTDAQRLGIPWGYYHFARPGDAALQAEFFRDNTKGYEKQGIPVLDFEDARLTNEWLNSFVLKYHDLTGVFPWVYMSSDFINNRGYGTEYVKKNCGLWLAGYPQKLTTYPAGSECPYKHDGWTLAAWQFTSSLSMGGMSIDGDFFYGDETAWMRYATGGDGVRSVVSGGGVSSDAAQNKISVDGWFGPKTIRLTQEVCGTKVDGVISQQPLANKTHVLTASGGWEWVAKPKGGSQVVAALQRIWGTEPDGWFGYNTVNAMERYYGVTPDGVLSGPSETVRRFQRALNAGKV